MKRTYLVISILNFLLSIFVVAFPEWFKMTDYDSLFGSKGGRIKIQFNTINSRCISFYPTLENVCIDDSPKSS